MLLSRLVWLCCLFCVVDLVGCRLLENREFTEKM